MYAAVCFNASCTSEPHAFYTSKHLENVNKKLTKFSLSSAGGLNGFSISKYSLQQPNRSFEFFQSRTRHSQKSDRRFEGLSVDAANSAAEGRKKASLGCIVIFVLRFQISFDMDDDDDNNNFGAPMATPTVAAEPARPPPSYDEHCQMAQQRRWLHHKMNSTDSLPSNYSSFDSSGSDFATELDATSGGSDNQR